MRIEKNAKGKAEPKSLLTKLLPTGITAALCIAGFTLSETDEPLTISQTSGMQVRGILFASILIASLGAVMDVCMSVATARAIHKQPGYGSKKAV